MARVGKIATSEEAETALVEAMKANRSLTSLMINIEYTDVSVDNIAKVIEANKTLKELELRVDKFNTVGFTSRKELMEKLAVALKKNFTLEKLALSTAVAHYVAGFQLSSDEMDGLDPALESTKTLKVLDLSKLLLQCIGKDNPSGYYRSWIMTVPKFNYRHVRVLL